MVDRTIKTSEANTAKFARDSAELVEYSKSQETTRDPGRLSVPAIRVEKVAESVRSSNDRTHSVSTLQSDATEKLLSATRTSEVDLERQATGHHEGIYWRSPNMMIGFFLLGVIASISHHFYYSSLDGKRVGNDNSQQWALR